MKMHDVRYACLVALLFASAACDVGRGRGVAHTKASESLAQANEADFSDRYTPQQIALNTFPSVVLLSMSDENSQPISIGSGFFIDDNVILTNAHVIEGASFGFAKPVGTETSFQITGTIGVDAQHDLALVEIEGSGTPLRLSTSGDPIIGATVFAIGNPQGFEGTFSQGIVSGIRAVGDARLLQITAPISPGSSGGPVLDDKGEVIGVATATYRGGQNLNFAVPAANIRDLNANRHAPVELGRATLRSARRPFPNIGDRLTTGVTGENLQWDHEYDFQGGGYSLTFRNKLNRPVQNVHALVVFYDRKGNPLETDVVTLNGVIPPGLARRVQGAVDMSVKRLTSNSIKSGTAYSLTPVTKIEIRVLGFDIID
ncbi:S1C family serine protease [Longimicrobium sp.]|uniref:S1C family serine protease n=1 Tax=Longimicrobium sp. TaxID=2029185 RepID=UPI003B3A2714